MIFKQSPTYTYDDVLLVPRNSNILSRGEVDTKQYLRTFRSAQVEEYDGVSINGGREYPYLPITLPIINSPMDSICSIEQYTAISSKGGIVCDHRFQPIEKQIIDLKNFYTIRPSNIIFSTIGAKEEDFIPRVDLILEHLPFHQFFLIDIANGHCDALKAPIDYLIKTVKNPVIMAGNVCTSEGYAKLIDMGVNIVRAGIGSGSMCTTRLMTGCGYGQFSTISEIAETKERYRKQYPNTYLVADGGIKNPGDMVKAIAAGADFVMAGRIFAGTKECPDWVFNQLDSKAVYRGQASSQFMTSHSIAKSDTRGAEGVNTLIPTDGSSLDVLDTYLASLKSAMTYIGARNIKELRDKAMFRLVTPSTYQEGNPRF